MQDKIHTSVCFSGKYQFAKCKTHIFFPHCKQSQLLCEFVQECVRILGCEHTQNIITLSLQEGSSRNHAPEPQWHRWKGAASCHASVGHTHRYHLHPLLHRPRGSWLQLGPITEFTRDTFGTGGHVFGASHVFRCAAVHQ
ncbi:proline-rich membrane anchor 1 isoform X2 [Danio rerio]|uniref:Proline-rich membrane anchor 1 isoform X2 n=1 Tax=Danio rerio TaxID=7955 RepID=A0AC58I596_DANRE